MTEYPLVSVIIPVYNRESHVPKTLDSLLAQTYPNFEVILVDDGSTDRSAEAIAPYLQDKVQYIKQDNAGAPTARNHGFSVSKGQYIIFFDSDDLMLPSRIEAQVKAIQAQNADACAAGYFINIVGGASYLPPLHGDGDLIRKFLNLELLGSTQSWMFSKELVTAVNGFDPSLSCRQDSDITFRILQRKPKVAMLNQALSLFMDHEGDDRIMNNWNNSKHLISKINYHKKVLAHVAAIKAEDLMRKAIDRFFWDVVPSYVKLKDYRKLLRLYAMVFDMSRPFKLLARIRIRLSALKSLLHWSASGLKK